MQSLQATDFWTTYGDQHYCYIWGEPLAMDLVLLRYLTGSITPSFSMRIGGRAKV